MSKLKTISESNFRFPNQTAVYKGKVRDVYFVDDFVIMIATDRISAFDHILPRAIPLKGQILNQMATYFLNATKEEVPNWWVASPDPNVSIGKKCTPFKIEVVVRNYLTGHAWRTYKSGQRMLCGIQLPDGLNENQKFETPIITPSTKADEGHDLDISKEEILGTGLVSKEDYEVIERYALKLFDKGTQMAAERGLILVDTKYEFGKDSEGNILLIDEIHTPDSSRYFYAEDYASRFSDGLPPRQLSKEFVREWLIEHGFQGLDEQIMPVMPDSFVNEVTERYQELYKIITDQELILDEEEPIRRIERNVMQWLLEQKKK